MCVWGVGGGGGGRGLLLTSVTVMMMQQQQFSQESLPPPFPALMDPPPQLRPSFTAPPVPLHHPPSRLPAASLLIFSFPFSLTRVLNRKQQLGWILFLLRLSKKKGLFL